MDIHGTTLITFRKRKASLASGIGDDAGRSPRPGSEVAGQAGRLKAFTKRFLSSKPPDR